MASFSVLGPLRARRRGHRIALGTPQQRAVLALLLLRRGEVVPVGDLVRAVWDEHPPRGAEGTIRTYVSRLRRALATVDIDNLAGGYVVQVRARDLDLAVYRDLVTRARDDRRAGRTAEALTGLRAAAGLWKGPPLTDIPGAYIRAQRAMLEPLRYAADRERRELEAGRRSRIQPALAVSTSYAGLAPAQLPPDLDDFAGRREVLDQLAVAARESRTVGVVGPAGVGTSSVAIRAAHRLRAEYPDGRLYVDLRATDVDSALAAFLRAYGISGPGPTNRAERIALWRQCLAGRRVLALLDHVTSAEQVETLRASLTLVTSHHRPAAPWVEVPPFSVDEGVMLLEQIAGPARIRAEPAAARQVVAAAQGQPLLVRIAGARIASRPHWTIADLSRPGPAR